MLYNIPYATAGEEITSER